MAKRTKKSAHAESLPTLRVRADKAAKQARVAKRAARHAKQQARDARKAFKQLRKQAKQAKLEWQRLTQQLERLLKDKPNDRTSRGSKRSRAKRKRPVKAKTI